ncbi:Choloylglycine hydrolase [compost metagenome]
MKTSILFISILLAALPAIPCSRVLWNSSGGDVIVGRNMDWFEDIRTNMWTLPRGMSRDGLAPENSMKWTSKYGSVVLSVYDVGVAEGLNEKGLTVNMLYLTESDFGKRNSNLPGMSVSLWAQYYLDNFMTVAEAIEETQRKPFQVLMATVGSKKGTVHLAMSDKSGDSAVIEYINGQPKIYHGHEYKVMTNSPPFSDQLTALKKYKGFGGQLALPGTTDAADRFVRAAYYLDHLPPSKDYREAVAGVFSVMRNVSQPFGEPDPARPYISTTRWRTVADLTKRVYFYESVLSPNVIWANASKINFAKGQPVKKITLVRNFDLIGDVTNKFKPTKMFDFLKPDIEPALKANR